MIRYSLICKDCNINVESWFASSKEYEKLKKKKLLNCHNCNSLNIDKSLMSPNINKKTYDRTENELKKYKKIKNTITEYQKFIKNNFDHVGENFAYEARAIHYNEKRKEKGIYGTASKKELKELGEEGIETQMIPWIEDNNN
jgi:hypothetical protein